LAINIHFVTARYAATGNELVRLFFNSGLLNKIICRSGSFAEKMLGDRIAPLPTEEVTGLSRGLSLP